MVETSGMVLRTFYRVPKHISRSNQKFQNQLPTTDPTINKRNARKNNTMNEPYDARAWDKAALFNFKDAKRATGAVGEDFY